MEKAICHKCGTPFFRPEKGYKKSFCSRSCANARVVTPEANAKRSESIKKYWTTLSIEERQSFSEGVKQRLRPVVNEKIHAYQEWFMNADWNELKHVTKRRRVMLEQHGKCLICNNDEWMGSPLTLELDHVDGNNKNNARENLRFLCPNCHSQTHTWRGRNNKGTKNSNYRHGLSCKAV